MGNCFASLPGIFLIKITKYRLPTAVEFGGMRTSKGSEAIASLGKAAESAGCRAAFQDL